MNRKLFFSAMVIFLLAFGLIGVSCLAGNELSGTWERVISSGATTSSSGLVPSSRIEIFEFTKGNNVTRKWVKREGEKGNEREEVFNFFEGTYSLKDDTIELSVGGETIIMFISKDKKTLTPEGEKLQFIRK
jgi:hypothetical protein